MYTTCILQHVNKEDLAMDNSEKIKMLREKTGMTRKEFCDYINIPYRTVTEWERGTRNAPDYVLRLLSYYIEMEQLKKNPTE